MHSIELFQAFMFGAVSIHCAVQLAVTVIRINELIGLFTRFSDSKVTNFINLFVVLGFVAKLRRSKQKGHKIRFNDAHSDLCETLPTGLM